ncbi:hypothetical protein E2562_002281 [Oryza meyeriana var. granulata]|uniref:Uncharacterized protein n=1 Tax=Oryza meyeriana var. granulata TaxID=110450 RepID=A0A6G1BHT1_9ORYZ|nr:hypothetical protein E2562_002281 [Oryza meyeriana var. granulata]
MGPQASDWGSRDRVHALGNTAAGPASARPHGSGHKGGKRGLARAGRWHGPGDQQLTAVRRTPTSDSYRRRAVALSEGGGLGEAIERLRSERDRAAAADGKEPKVEGERKGRVVAASMAFLPVVKGKQGSPCLG